MHGLAQVGTGTDFLSVYYTHADDPRPLQSGAVGRRAPYLPDAAGARIEARHVASRTVSAAARESTRPHPAARQRVCPPVMQAVVEELLEGTTAVHNHALVSAE